MLSITSITSMTSMTSMTSIPLVQKLPTEIIHFIFLFDNTFKTYFSNHVLPYLAKRRLFQVTPKTSLSFKTQKKLFLMIDEDYAKIMNSLTNPTFCSTIFFSKNPSPCNFLIARSESSSLLPITVR